MNTFRRSCTEPLEGLLYQVAVCAFRHRMARCVLVGVLSLWLAKGSLGAPPPTSSGSVPPANGAAQLAPDVDQELPDCIERLGAAKYSVRNGATEAILNHGSTAIPFLVQALSNPSREIQFRAGQLLRHCYTFEEVARPLLADVRATNRPASRSVLLERSVKQVNSTTSMQSAAKLFEFWGTSLTAYRRNVLNGLAEARSGDEIAKAVTPLIDLEEKAARFDAITTRMSVYGLSYKSQYSATYTVAKTLARGLLQDNPAEIEFAERYVRAFDRLARSLQAAGRPASAVRKEITDRAVYSQGAAAFLVDTIDPQSSINKILTAKLHVSSAELRDQFLTGLAEPNGKECYRRIGKTHIADMLIEAIRPWGATTPEPAVTRLVDATIQTIRTGNKPKALALLDALDACNNLPKHGLSVTTGFGQQLIGRLVDGALQASDNRAYHPTRALHNRIISLWDLGITPDHLVFPQTLIDDYIAGKPGITSEAPRQALDRFVRVLAALHNAHVSLDEPSLQPFLCHIRDAMADDPAALAVALTHTLRLTERARAASALASPATIVRELTQSTNTNRK